MSMFIVLLFFEFLEYMSFFHDFRDIVRKYGWRPTAETSVFYKKAKFFLLQKIAQTSSIIYSYASSDNKSFRVYVAICLFGSFMEMYNDLVYDWGFF